MANPTVAGRELDALVAEKVMGLKRVELEWIRANYPQYLDVSDKGTQTIWVDAKGKLVYCTTCGNMPAYSTEITAAWQVVEKVNEEHGLEFIYNRVCEEGNPRFVRFYWAAGSGGQKFDAVADTAPLAICLAALKALSTSEEEKDG